MQGRSIEGRVEESGHGSAYLQVQTGIQEPGLISYWQYIYVYVCSAHITLF